MNIKFRIKAFFDSILSIQYRERCKMFYIFGYVITIKIATARCKVPNLQIKEKNVFIFTPHLGDTVVLARLIHALKQKNNNDICFIATQKQHKEMINLFAPETSVILFENFSQAVLYCRSYKKKLTVCFNDDFWQGAPRKGKRHNYDSFINYLKLNRDEIVHPEMQIPEEIEHVVLNKIKAIGLKDNFVILSPEAQTAILLNKSFWSELCLFLKKYDYDIFVNAINSKNKIDGTKSCELSCTEALVLAKKAQLVIGLRSGLLDLFACINDIEMYVIYSGRATIKVHSLLGYDYVKSNKIHEFDLTSSSTLTSDEVLMMIMNKIELRQN